MKYIGVVGRSNDGIKFNQEIINVIYEFGFTPIGIIVDFKGDSNLSFNRIKGLIDMCDGFILQGGSDYFEIDKLITKYLYNKNIPTLGICLGMQIMSMTFNGQMGAIAMHLSNNQYVHSVNIEPNSYLYSIIGKEKISVNSRHKDSIIKTDLNVSASNDIIEAVEEPDKKFFIGVQWHPESLMDEESYKLFNEFFKKCE